MSLFLLRVNRHENDFKVSWTIIDGSDVTEPPAYLVDVGSLQQAAANVRRQLNVIAFSDQRLSPPDFAELLKRLARLGRTLFNRLTDPPDSNSEIQQLFKKIASESEIERHDLRVTIETPELFVPWGFVFPGDLKDVTAADRINMSLNDMKGFWLSAFKISVTYGGSSALPRQRKGTNRKLYALHEDMWGKATKLLKAVDAECHKRLEELLDGDMPPAMDWDAFRDAWNVVGDDHDSVLYFFGHSNGQHIELRENTTPGVNPTYDLSATELFDFKKQRSGGSAAIFFLNGCRTAAPHIDQALGYVPISANFLKATRQQGYFGYIGTETEVSNIFACRYGTEFMWRLYRGGLSVGQAFDELLQDKRLFPQNLLYACYADRKFSLSVGTEKGQA